MKELRVLRDIPCRRAQRQQQMCPLDATPHILSQARDLAQARRSLEHDRPDLRCKACTEKYRIEHIFNGANMKPRTSSGFSQTARWFPVGESKSDDNEEDGKGTCWSIVQRQ
jgi:hypothetical protein